MRACVLAGLAVIVLAGAVARADSTSPMTTTTTTATSPPPTPPPPILPPPKADDTAAPARTDPVQLDRAYKRAKYTRNIGVGLAAPGIALSIVGGVLIGFGSTSPNLFDQIDKIIAGVITGGVGLVIGIPGIYFWSTGQDDMDSVVWRRRQMLISSPR
ncbi:MAG TPA: hypothetical protein VGL86_03505 [Polyangia bacterium]|jgi:hypothetical protein